MLGISIVSLVILLGVLIFAHEIGHFLAAKYCGVKVLKFSLGFGPRLIGKKWGETEYLISIFPLGGYVKLLGESESEDIDESDMNRSFSTQSVLRRMAIVAAGPLFNFILAILIFTCVYMYGIPVLMTKIGDIQQGSPAFSSGITKGDVVTKINGKNIRKWEDLSDMVTASKGAPLTFEFKRDSHRYSALIKPRLQKAKNIFGEEVESYKIGVMPAEAFYTERRNPVSAFWEGLKHTWLITKMTFLSLYKMMEGVISPKNLGGPILIAQIAGKQAQEGVIPFLFFMALLSINLGVLNLLPIPVLDGGHLLFFLIEVVKGSPVKPKWREFAQTVGFTILIILMIFVFYFDLTRT
ncbi:MAG: RIP metalloprotease RseP [Smithella sp.]